MFPGRRQVGDVLRTLVLAGFVLGATTMAARQQPEARALDPVGYGWLVAAALPLLACRRYPMLAFAVSSVLALTYYWSGYPGGPVIVLPGAALFVLTRVRGPATASVAGGALLAALYLVHGTSDGDWLPPLPAAGLVAGVAAVIGIGTALRHRKAAQRATREQQAEHAQRLAEQDRLRVAREVHDVVAHSLAMINVQAGVAAHVADRRPEEARKALQHIKEASAEALTDLRATLEVLRGGDRKEGVAEASASLRHIAELIDHAQAVGIDVYVRGEPGDLPPDVDGAAYRILQESLTNVIRHANQPSSVTVQFGRRDGALEMVVRDDGMGATAPRLGNGLRGMRERSEALGGRFTASATVEGGFEVRATLPVPAAPS
ncbi:sensor histidine kinase [Amycolatopsis cihanbeyliensis]